MPPPPLIASRAGQRCAVAGAMALMLVVSLVLAWSLGGAAVALPGGAIAAGPTTGPAVEPDPTTQVHTITLRYELPPGWEQAPGRELAALEGEQAVYTDPQRPTRWLVAAKMQTADVTAPAALVRALAQRVVAPAAEDDADPRLAATSTIAPGSLVLAPPEGAGGPVDIFAAHSFQGRLHWVFYLHDEAASPEERGPVIEQALDAFRQTYTSAQLQVAATTAADQETEQ